MTASILAPVRPLFKNDFVRHGAVVFCSSMVVNVSNYAFHVFMTRSLGPSVYGALSSMLALTAILSLPSVIISMAVAKHTAELKAGGHDESVAAISRRIISLSAVAGIIVLLLCVLASTSIAAYLQVSKPAYIWAVGLIVCFGLINPGVRGVLQGKQDFVNLAATTAIEGVGKCLLGIGAVAIGLGLRGALCGYAVACAMSIAFGIGALRIYGFDSAASVRKADFHIRRLGLSVLSIAFATAIIQLGTSADVVVVKHFFEPRVAGLYSAISLAGKSMLFFVGFVPALVLPKAAAHRSDAARRHKVLWAGLGVTAALCGGVLVGFFFAPQLIMTIFSGSRYVDGAPYLPLYATAMTLFAATTVVINYQIALHRFGFVWPLCLVYGAQLTMMAVLHRSLWDIIVTLVIGNGLLLICACVGRVPQLRSRFVK